MKWFIILLMTLILLVIPSISLAAEDKIFVGPQSYVIGKTLVFDGGIQQKVLDDSNQWVDCEKSISYKQEVGKITFFFGKDSFIINYDYGISKDTPLIGKSINDVVGFDIKQKGCSYYYTQNVSDKSLILHNLTYTFPVNYKVDGYKIVNDKISLDMSKAVKEQGIEIIGKSTADGIILSGVNIDKLDPDINFSTTQPICGTYNYDNIIINNSAKLTVCGYNTVGQNGTVTFNATTITMYGGVVINGTQAGYGPNIGANGSGPGGGQGGGAGYYAGGGAYGGAGGNGFGVGGVGGQAYGSSSNVTSMGSAGGSSNSYLGGRGGALIIFNASSILNLTGNITNNGASINAASSSGAPGSGGGIVLYANQFYGSLNITAFGGSVIGSGLMGAGGGGRIYIQYCSNISAVTFNVSGGNKGTSASPGTNGTDGTFNMSQSDNCYPTISSVVITPSNPNRNSNLLGNCSATDSGNISLNYTWYKNNVLNITGNLSNVVPGNYNLANITHPLIYNNNWTFSCIACDINGCGSWTNSTPIVVNNTAPNTVNPTISPASATTSTNINCINGTMSDSDNDNITVYYNWQNSTTNIPANFVNINVNVSNLTSGNLTNNNFYRCQVWVGDGLLNSSVYNATIQIGVGFVSPTVTSVNATYNGVNSNYTNPTNDNLNLTFKANWNSSNSTNGTLFICDSTSSWINTGCSGVTYCTNMSNYAPGIVSCSMNDLSSFSLSNYTFNAFINATNYTVISLGTIGNFSINHAPSIPATVGPISPSPNPAGSTTATVPWVSASDSDNNLITYLISTSTDNVVYSNVLNTSSLSYTYNTSDGGTFYIRISTADSFNYSTGLYSSYSFTQNNAVVVNPPSGGGGSIPDTTAEDKDCNITLSAISFDLSDRIVQTQITNNEAFSISPQYTVGISSLSIVSGLQSVIAPGQTQTIVFSINNVTNTTGNVTMKADGCKQKTFELIFNNKVASSIMDFFFKSFYDWSFFGLFIIPLSFGLTSILCFIILLLGFRYLLHSENVAANITFSLILSLLIGILLKRIMSGAFI